MNSWLKTHEAPPAKRKLPTENLKCCPLCGVLNAKQNAECFVCRWHGDFDHSPRLIEERLEELLVRCPELADAIAEPEEIEPTFLERVRAWFGGLLGRRLDLRV